MATYRAMALSTASRMWLRLRKPMRRVILLAVLASMLAACNVTRVVTTECRYYTSGDSTITIVTRTVESYDAAKKSGK